MSQVKFKFQLGNWSDEWPDTNYIKNHIFFFLYFPPAGTVQLLHILNCINGILNISYNFLHLGRTFNITVVICPYPVFVVLSPLLY